jgi:hypothetical protein
LESCVSYALSCSGSAETDGLPLPFPTVPSLAASGDSYDNIYDALADNGAKTYLEGAKKANRFDKQLSDPGTIATVFAPSDRVRLAAMRWFHRIFAASA